jgi:NTP pyrophosphatase (non-canonical NTP hydrolase)
MNADKYQKLAARTLIKKFNRDITDEEVMILWNVIGVSGEAGELTDMIKKGIFHGHGLDKEKIIKEAGDVLWYISALLKVLGVSLSEAMETNIEKLKARYPDGFDYERTKFREGKAE